MTALAKSEIPRALWLVAALAIAARAVIAAVTGFTNEDSMITLRYAEHWAVGEGLVYNAGERVLGTTTPLYALLLGLGAKLGLPAMLLGKSLNIMADGALCLVVFQWVRSLGWDRAALLAAFLVAVNPLHARWSVSGMETSLVALAGMKAWLCYAQRRYLVCYAVLGVLFLLRWDSLMLTGVLTVAVLVRERRLPWREMLLFALIAGPWVAYATWFYGSPIPVTAASKMAVYGWQFPGLVPQAHKLLALLFGNPAYVVSTLFAGVGIVVLARHGWRDAETERQRDGMVRWAPALVWLAVYWAAWSVSKVLLFEWYVVPPLPIWETFVAIGAVAAWRHVARSRVPTPDSQCPSRLHPSSFILHPLAIAVAAFGFWRTYYLCDANQRVEEAVRKPLALWLRAQASPDDTVMLEPIGYIGYYSRLRVLDVIGLVSPQVIPFWKPGAGEPLLDLARAYRPEWIVLRPTELARIEGAAARYGMPWSETYTLERTWDYVPPDPDRDRVTFHVFKRRAVRAP